MTMTGTQTYFISRQTVLYFLPASITDSSVLKTVIKQSMLGFCFGFDMIEARSEFCPPITPSTLFTSSITNYNWLVMPYKLYKSLIKRLPLLGL